MEDIRKRMIRELVFAPASLFPILAGASAWLLSWAGGGFPQLNVIGLVGVLGGLGWMAFRGLFRRDSIEQKILKEEAEKLRNEEEAEIDQLQQRLRADRDFRTKESLAALKLVRKDFDEVSMNPSMALRSVEVFKQLRQLFRTALEQLEYSVNLYDRAERLSDPQRQELLAQREDVVKQISESVGRMQTAVNQLREIAHRDQQTELNTLQEELDASLRVAKRTEERMKELESYPGSDSFLRE